jgi:hypothetical protein
LLSGDCYRLSAVISRFALHLASAECCLPVLCPLLSLYMSLLLPTRALLRYWLSHRSGPMLAGLVWHPWQSKALCSQELFGIPMLAGLVVPSLRCCTCNPTHLFGTPIPQGPMLAGLGWHPYARFHTCLASLCSSDLFGIPMLVRLVWHPSKP